jgi:predicted transcriptional regulator
MDDLSNPPVCKNCRGLSHQNAVSDLSNTLNHIQKLPNIAKNIARIGLGLGVLLVLGLFVFLRSRGLMFSFGTISIFLALIAVVGGFVFLSRKTHKRKKEHITAAQIETLLKVNNKLTPRRLASATNTSIEYAKKVLDALAVEGKLDVSSDAHELIYTHSSHPSGV